MNEKQQLDELNTQKHKEKAEKLKKAYQETTNQAKIARQKEEEDAWLAKQQDAIAKFMNKKIMHEGRELTPWDVVKSEIKKATHLEQNAYHDWRAAMIALLSIFSSLVEAVNHSAEKKWRPLTLGVKQLLRQKMMVPLKDYLKGSAELSPLVHNVTMDNEGKLNFGLTRADKRSEMGEMNARFKVLVDLWLSEHGYQASAANDGTYVKKISEDHEERLTPELFNKMKHSEENGLDEFLNRDSSLKFEEAVEAESKPIPTTSLGR